MTERIGVRGTELAYQSIGDGRPFVWGHGLSSSRAREDEGGLAGWLDLADAGVRTIRFDARGHGESGATPDPDDYRWDSLAVDLLALADGLGIDTFVCGGASMGCATTLHVAVRAPERVQAMVLMIPPTAWETRAAQAAIYEGGADLVERGGIETMVRLSAAVPPPPILAEDPALAVFRPDLVPGFEATVFRGAARSDLPPREAIAALTQPTLLLAWDTDPGHPVSTAEALADLLPKADLRIATTMDEVRGDWPGVVREFLR